MNIFFSGNQMKGAFAPAWNLVIERSTLFGISCHWISPPYAFDIFKEKSLKNFVFEFAISRSGRSPHIVCRIDCIADVMPVAAIEWNAHVDLISVLEETTNRHFYFVCGLQLTAVVLHSRMDVHSPRESKFLSLLEGKAGKSRNSRTSSALQSVAELVGLCRLPIWTATRRSSRTTWHWRSRRTSPIEPSRSLQIFFDSWKLSSFPLPGFNTQCPAAPAKDRTYPSLRFRSSSKSLSRFLSSRIRWT